MSKVSLLELCNGEKKYGKLNKQVKNLTAFPSSQMNRAKLDLAISWRGIV